MVISVSIGASGYGVPGVQRLAGDPRAAVDRDRLVVDDQRGRRVDRGRRLHDEEPVPATQGEQDDEHDREQASTASAPASTPETARLRSGGRRDGLLLDGRRRWLNGHRRGRLAWSGA